ncbi:MAG: serine/threonine-protein kinase, partial [Planctomycetota bacterium]
MTAVKLTPGEVLNHRYRLERLLGEGGMGQVFLSLDLESGEPVALKTLEPPLADADRRRFEREIRTLKTLDHPNIVSFRDVGRWNGSLFYTMEYYRGTTLEEVLRARGRVSSAEELDWYLQITIQIAEALDYLHKRRLVHRDIKPSNILLRAADSETNPEAAEWVKLKKVRAGLADFGLVKVRDSDRPLTSTALGTPQYMSPEQVEASPAVDERSDLYSLGVILYRTVTGELPYARLSELLSRKPAASVREHNREMIPELLAESVHKLLEFEPYRRPAGASELIETLHAVLERKTRLELGEPVISKVAQPAFCGRQKELQLLKSVAARAAQGTGHWVSICGELGTGKTWLVSRSDFKTHAAVTH